MNVNANVHHFFKFKDTKSQVLDSISKVKLWNDFFYFNFVQRTLINVQFSIKRNKRQKNRRWKKRETKCEKKEWTKKRK